MDYTYDQEYTQVITLPICLLFVFNLSVYAWIIQTLVRFLLMVKW